jgi:MoxR-like ATPase
LATQNPIEQEGTYPLPEAQQDRFMFSVEIDYPSFDDELAIAKISTGTQGSQISAVVSSQQLRLYRELILRVPVADSVVAYAVKLTRSSRPPSAECPPPVRTLLTWGAGPRGSQYLILAAKTFAVLDGRPTPDAADVQRAAYSVLRHRLVRSFHAEAEGVSANDIVKMLLENMKS